MNVRNCGVAGAAECLFALIGASSAQTGELATVLAEQPK